MSAPSAAASPAGPRPTPLVGDAARRGIPVEIMTPEGVPLLLRIAPAGDRASAFLLDLLFLVLIVVAVFVVMLVGMFGGIESVATTFGILFLFLARTFYFTWFEIRRQGTTPGKRRVGLRVMDAHGGPLTAEAVIARNLTREVEIFLPLSVVFWPKAMGFGGPGWLQMLALAWVFVFGLFPLFNRRRMRAGDLIAGTLVILEPRTTLLSDLGRGAASGAGAPAAHAFTDAQLDVYGNYELQVLEDVLRRAKGVDADPKTLGVVAKKICRKIGYEGQVDRPEPFLRAFYAALRARLEHRLVLGRAKADKHAE